ncbi:putative lipoprotein [Enterobacter cancerogenus]|uniref:Putative lipoprotein n=1 Tax=Enterobacter cancerogenus TaxID=69218 RepID=A0A484Z6A3_9ENTR|nr:putative lipoprotein [Enterobacter cancerogenus]
MRILLLLISLCLTGCSHMANDSWTGQDKAQHFIASAMLSAAGNEVAQHQGYSRDRSAAIGLMFSVSLGASKELWDSRPAGNRLELERFCLGRSRCNNRLRGMADGPLLKANTLTLAMQHQGDDKG